MGKHGNARFYSLPKCSGQCAKVRKAFAGAVYQNQKSICPRHQMLLPRIIKG